MVATDLRNPDLIMEAQTYTVSNASRDTASVSMSKESPGTDVMRLRVSIGGKFFQVRDLNFCFFWTLNNVLCCLLCSALLAILTQQYLNRHTLQREPGAWNYSGGDTFLESVPVSWKYADLVFSLAEKVDGAISLKYQLPGEDLDPDALISVADDSDIAVSFIFPPQFNFS